MEDCAMHKSIILDTKYKMNKLKFVIVLVASVFTGFSGYSQSDCPTIQCDCENIPDSDKDPGLKALCEYYERSMIELCENGEKNLKCHITAKGPNAWKGLKNVSDITKTKNVLPIKIPATSIDNIDNLLLEIRNSENKFAKYTELHSRLESLQQNTTGLLLAMQMADYFTNVHIANSNIEFEIMFMTYSSKYSEDVLEMHLEKMIEPLKLISELDLDQVDMKFELAKIFRDMKNSGLDVLSSFSEGNIYQNEEVLSFIKECYASNPENATKREMLQLRETSNRIFLREMDNLIPLSVKSELTDPIYYINKGVLYWNEKLINESINTLKVLAEFVEKKQWDKKKVDRAYSKFKKVYNEELWPSSYDKYFITISKEHPIVWEMLSAIFVQ